MGDLLKDLADKLKKEEARRKVAEIDGKVRKCDEVRGNLESCKTSLDNEISDWERVKTKLNSSARYTTVVTANVFEGEMAERLGEYMTDVNGDIRSGISAAESLSDELQTQISALDTYRGTLMANRARWASQL